MGPKLTCLQGGASLCLLLWPFQRPKLSDHNKIQRWAAAPSPLPPKSFLWSGAEISSLTPWKDFCVCSVYLPVRLPPIAIYDNFWWILASSWNEYTHGVRSCTWSVGVHFRKRLKRFRKLQFVHNSFFEQRLTNRMDLSAKFSIRCINYPTMLTWPDLRPGLQR